MANKKYEQMFNVNDHRLLDGDQYQQVVLTEMKEEDMQKIAQERANEIKHVAHQVIEIKDIFNDVQGLVQHQGTVLDCIEDNISSSGNNVKSGIIEIDKAEHYQKSSTGMCLWILVALLIIVLIVVVTIIIYNVAK